MGNAYGTKEDHLTGIRSINDSSKISLSEIVGRRYKGNLGDQQDSAFVGKLNKREKAAKNPKEFFEETIKKIVENHQECENGTTLCSAIITPPLAVTKYPQITTANLGDSRASLIIKYKEGEEIKYVSVSLTEDHKPNLSRVGKHIEEKKGLIINKRVNGNLAIGGTIGDKSVWNFDEESKDCLLRTPDIWQHDPEKVITDLKTINAIPEASNAVEIDFVVTCDGVFDVIENDYEYVLEGDKLKLAKSGHEKASLASIKKDFDELPTSFGEESKPANTSFSDYLTNQAYEAGSGDNISAIHVPIVANGKIKITDPIIATVCDGHGGSNAQSVFDPLEKIWKIKNDDAYIIDTNQTHGRTSHQDQILVDAKPLFDGSIVSASVAAELYVAAQVKEIPGLEIDSTRHQKNLAKLIKQKDTSRPLESEMNSLGQRDYRDILQNETSDHLPQQFKINLKKESEAGSSEIKVLTWNILQQCGLMSSGTTIYNNPWNYTESDEDFGKRRKAQAEKLKELSKDTDIICLQECDFGTAQYFLNQLNSKDRDKFGLAVLEDVTEEGKTSKANITIYNTKFSIISRGSSTTLLSGSKYCGLSTTFSDPISGSSFIIENAHAPFGKPKLIEGNVTEISSLRKLPLISVGDYNIDSSKLKNIGTISSGKATNFDGSSSKIGGILQYARGDNEEMFIDSKSYDMAHIYLPKGYTADVEHTAKYFEKDLTVTDKKRSFEVAPGGKVTDKESDRSVDETVEECEISLLGNHDILDSDCAAIVNAGNLDLSLGSRAGGLSGAIHKYFGADELAQALVKSAKEQRVLKTGSVHELKEGNSVVVKLSENKQKKTYDQKIEYLIHTAGPNCNESRYDYKDPTKAKARKDALRAAYDSALKAAVAEGIKTICLPALSVGIFNMPRDEAAEVIAKVLQEYRPQFKKIEVRALGQQALMNDIDGRLKAKKTKSKTTTASSTKNDGPKPFAISKSEAERLKKAQTAYQDAVYDVFKGGADAAKRVALRDSLAAAACPKDVLNELRLGAAQLDTTEFLNFLLDSSMPEENRIDAISKVEWETSPGITRERLKEEKQTKLEFSFPSDESIAVSCQNMLDAYREPENLTGENQFQVSKGLNVDATKRLEPKVTNPNAEIVISLKRFKYVNENGRLAGKKINTSVNLDNIKLPLKDGSGIQEYRATSFIVHQGVYGGGHYVTYIQESDNKWYCYNDETRSEVSDDRRLDGKLIEAEEVLEQAKSQAYVVKYSPINEHGQCDLPESQGNGTINGGNRCWANAAFAFALSMKSQHNLGHVRSGYIAESSQEAVRKKKEELKPLLSSKTDKELELYSNFETMLDFALSDANGDKNFVQLLGHLELAKSSAQDKAFIDKNLTTLGLPTTGTLLQNAAQRYLLDLANRVSNDDSKFTFILNLNEFFSDEKNIKTTLQIVKAIDGDQSGFFADPKSFCEIKDSSLNSKAPKPTDTLGFCYEAIHEGDREKFEKFLPYAIKQDRDFLTNALCCAIYSDKGAEIAEILINNYKANPNKKSPLYGKSAKEIADELGKTLTKPKPITPIHEPLTTTKPAIQTSEQKPEQKIAYILGKTNETSLEHGKVSLTAQDFGGITSNKEFELSVAAGATSKKIKINKEQYLDSSDPKTKKYRSIITPEILHFEEFKKDKDGKILQDESGENKLEQKYWYSEFGALKFDETSGKKIFDKADLFMASFRNCVFSNVDFSEVKNFETIGFNENCIFVGNCKFPEGFDKNNLNKRPSSSPEKPIATRVARAMSEEL